MRSMGWLARRIWRQGGWRFVSVEEPYFSSCEIAQYLLILLVAHVARPDNFGMVNIRGVVNPLPVHIVTGPVAHDDQVLTRKALQFTHDGRTIQVSSWPRRLNLCMCGRSGDAQ